MRAGTEKEIRLSNGHAKGATPLTSQRELEINGLLVRGEVGDAPR